LVCSIADILAACIKESNMFKKSARAVAASLVVLGAIGSAHALSITAGNYTFIISNYDSGTTGYPVGAPVCTTVAGCDAVPGIVKAPGSGASSYDTMGIFTIESIKNETTGQNIFQAGGADGWIVGVFGQLADYRVDRGVLGANDLTSTLSTGGVWTMYRTAANYDPTVGPLGAGVDFVGTPGDPLSLLYPSITDVGGEVWLNGRFVPGAIAGDVTTTYTATFNSNTFAGGGQGFLDIDGGTAQSLFDTDALADANGVLRDMFLDVTFNDVDGQAAALGWTVTSAGQILGSVNEAPEPSALALVGLGLGLAGFASRRQKAKG
jgi:hypothetical protein